MTSERVLQIGRVRWRLDGPLPEPDRLGVAGRFLSDGADAEITVELRRCDRLPEPEGALRWEDWFYRVYESDETCCIRRIASAATERVHYAALCWRKDAPDRQTLYLDESRLACNGDRLVSALAMDLALHRYGHGILHAAWIERGGQAVWFSGPSRTGKSTQADYWRQERGATVLNGDKAAFYFENGRAVATGLPFAGTSEFCENRTMPLRAIVMLAQAEENALVRLPLGEAVKRLLSQMPVQPWSREDLQAIADQAALLAGCVPVYELRCRLGPETVGLLDEELSKEDPQWNP